jgi:predicted nucleotidyltransferase
LDSVRQVDKKISTRTMTVSGADRLLSEIVSRIQAAAHPERIILFGSRARGTPRPDSDFDVLVVQHSDEPRYRRAAPLYTALADVPAEVEVMVYTPSEIAEWSEVPNAFVTTALREGKILYEKRD